MRRNVPCRTSHRLKEYESAHDLQTNIKAISHQNLRKNISTGKFKPISCICDLGLDPENVI